MGSMLSLPERHSLVNQTSAVLRQEIGLGTWRRLLPGERQLCESLQVSRNTLRAALAQLKREGLVTTVPGAGTKILAKSGRQQNLLRSHDVAMLSPDPLEQLRPTHTLWIDELRGLLSERGCRVRFFHGLQYFRGASGSALDKLVKQNPHGCWIPIFSNEGTQRWFERNKIPCVVAGSLYPGVNLPFRDIDHKAVCRHAVGVMLSLGHRRIALLIRKSLRAGDLESEAAFKEAAHQSPHVGVEPIVVYHQATYPTICTSLRRLMEAKDPPTALLVANPYHYLTAVTWLTGSGWRVPQRISVVSRDEDSFLSFVHPPVARYVVAPHVMAKALLKPIFEILRGGGTGHHTGWIMPNFIRGGTLAAPPTIGNP